MKEQSKLPSIIRGPFREYAIHLVTNNVFDQVCSYGVVFVLLLNLIM